MEACRAKSDVANCRLNIRQCNRKGCLAEERDRPTVRKIQLTANREASDIGMSKKNLPAKKQKLHTDKKDTQMDIFTASPTLGNKTKLELTE